MVEVITDSNDGYESQNKNMNMKNVYIYQDREKIRNRDFFADCHSGDDFSAFFIKILFTLPLLSISETSLDWPNWIG